MSFRGYVSGQKGCVFPERWKQGPNNTKRIVNRWFLMAKAQAKHRDELWELDFEDYWTFWNGYTDRRGKKAGDYQLRRMDEKQPWHRNNCVLQQRGKNGSTT